MVILTVGHNFDPWVGYIGAPVIGVLALILAPREKKRQALLFAAGMFAFGAIIYFLR